MLTGLRARLLPVPSDGPPVAAAMTADEASLSAAVMNRWALSAAVRLMAAACVAACLVSLLAIAVAVWALTRPVEPRYFATRTTGELVELTPLDRPHLNDAQVVTFATEAMLSSLSIDFANWREDLAGSAHYFSTAGYQAFLDELERSGNLDLIRRRRMVASAVANGAVVVRKGLTGGRVYAWHVEIPLTVTYQSSSESRAQQMTLLVELRRVPTWTSDWGVAVERLVGKSSR